MESKTIQKQGDQSLTVFNQPLGQYIQQVNPKGINDVLKSEAGILRKLIAERGESEVKGMIVDMIIDLNKFFNFSRIMNGKQSIETAELIIELFPIYTPEDFILCFKNIKTLKYGKFFEGIDGSKILEMIRAYDIDRDEQISEHRQKEAAKYKQDMKQMPEAIYEASKKIMDKTEEIKRPIPTPVNEYDLIMKGYMKEFDEMHNKQRPVSRGIKFVDYKTGTYDIATFCNIRFMEDYIK